MAPARASKRKADAVDAKKTDEKQTTANTSAPRKGLKERKIITAKPKAAAKVTKTTKKPAEKAEKAELVEEADEVEKVTEKTTEKIKVTRKAKMADKTEPVVAPILPKSPAGKRGRRAPASSPPPESLTQSFNTTQSFNEDEEVAHGEKAPPRKKGRTEANAAINTLPTVKLNVYAFGTGDNAELGLGPEPNAKIVKRPRLNTFLLPDKVGVVAVSIGGMHGLALTHEGKVYSWGVNDQYALGRETKVAPREKNVETDEDDDEDDEPLNPLESTPMLVEGFPEGTIITRIAAGDSVSVAVTDTGKVYAWGTFRCSDGILGFSSKVRVQPRPTLMPTIKNIIDISVGNDHVLALSKDGAVYAWGNGQQFQLGRRVVERTRMNGLIPREFGLPRKQVKYVSTGSYHSFAITKDGRVWAWGLNQFGQCGIYDEQKAGEDSTVVPVPTVVEYLEKYKIVQIAAGEHHSAAITEDGDLLMWGRLDAHQLGVDISTLPADDIVHDVAGKPRYLAVPHTITDRKFSYIGCGTHHNIAIARDGTAWSWGFGDSYQTGQGPPAEDVPLPTKIENTATKDIKMMYADAGGQFSVMAGVPAPQTNGVNRTS